MWWLYKLGYDESPATAAPRLVSVTKQTVATAAEPARTWRKNFYWEAAKGSFGMPSFPFPITAAEMQNGANPVVIDYDGDGKDEILSGRQPEHRSSQQPFSASTAGDQDGHPDHSR